MKLGSVINKGIPATVTYASDKGIHHKRGYVIDDTIDMVIVRRGNVDTKVLRKAIKMISK